jgi:pantoate--beta-alanine ligase
VVSIYVNPTQFGAGEDLDSYPKSMERDIEVVKESGGDVIFAPEDGEMYPKGYSTYVNVEGSLTKGLCGASRDGHFRGVATIVSKLFNIAGPDRAYFGQKDAQQVAVITQMAKDMNLRVEVVPCPIVREDSGLALSSRNAYLTESQKHDALVLNKSLKLAEKLFLAGERDADLIKIKMKELITTADCAEIDYIEIVDALSLENVKRIESDVLIALAVKIGKPRLIDNMTLKFRNEGK